MKDNLKIGIIGLGLIGGSIALRLVECGYIVTGFTSNEQTVKDASFPCFTDYANLKQCNIVIVCSPLGKILDTLEKISPHLAPGTIVTDVGSVKEFICNQAPNIIPNHSKFIGGHPMAGTEKIGFANAFSELFNNRTWILTEENSILQQIITDIGANAVIAQPQIHDQAAALISHVPLLLSIGLLNTLNNLPAEKSELKELAQTMASTGFEGMVRLAKGNPELNHDLLHHNAAQVSEIYNIFLQEINKAKE